MLEVLKGDFCSQSHLCYQVNKMPLISSNSPCIIYVLKLSPSRDNKEVASTRSA